MLTETQSPALFGRQLSGYTVFTIPATSLGRAGEGVLLAVRQQLPFSVSHWQTDQANRTIWLTLKPAQSRQHPLTVGVCYIPPESHRSAQLSRRSAQVRFESLAAHIAQLSSGGHVLLAGDFNARVGAAAQPWITDLSDDASAQLQSSDSTLNGHGRKLLHLCEETAMVLCTGKTLETPRLSPVSKRAETLQPPAWTMLWWTVACLPPSKLAALPLTGRSLTTFHWSCVCSSLRLLHRHHCPQPRPPFLVGFGTAAF